MKGRYYIWCDSESAIDLPQEYQGLMFKNIDDAYNLAVNFVHAHDGKPYRVIAHVENDLLGETIETVENLTQL